MRSGVDDMMTSDAFVVTDTGARGLAPQNLNFEASLLGKTVRGPARRYPA
jgi:hypothetical protein